MPICPGKEESGQSLQLHPEKGLAGDTPLSLKALESLQWSLVVKEQERGLWSPTTLGQVPITTPHLLPKTRWELSVGPGPSGVGRPSACGKGRIG